MVYFLITGRSVSLLTISYHILHVVATPRNREEPYLVAYLNCDIGQKIIWREAYGATRPAIDFPSIRFLTIPTPLQVTQTYIGNKILQAVLLREWAKQIEHNVTLFNIALMPNQEGLDFSSKTRQVPVSKMTERLDAHFYPAVVEQYLSDSSVNFEQLSLLCDAIFNGQTQPETTAEDGNCFQITVTNLSSIFIGGKPRIVEKPPTKARFLKPKDLLICNAAHNKSYIGRDITFYHGESDLLPSTEVMVIRVNKQLIPSSYLRAYFLTKLGYVQIQSTIRGITAHSYPVDVGKLEIPVPIMDDQKRDEWFACDDLMIKAGIANDLSVKLTQTAKFLIEALIEGQLTEAELINAHQALENGDNSLDKAILANITDKGYGVKGKPLFSDLDALYRLLDKVEADQTKGDL